jgi:chromosome segregation ATPase
MIDKRYIESAKQIRSEYLRLNDELNRYQDDVKELGEFLLRKVEDLKNFNDEEIKKAKTKDELSQLTKVLVSNLTEIEEKEKIIGSKVNDINKKIERLKKDEIVLYNTLREKYPEMTNEELRDEVQSHLEK